MKLEQSLCVNIQICQSFYDLKNIYNQAIICGNPPFRGPYCCGGCDNRFCCSDSSQAFNQNECKTVTSTKTDNYIINKYTTASQKSPEAAYFINYILL